VRFGRSVVGRSAASCAARGCGVLLAAGLVVTSIATATPVGASETMKADLHKLRICESGDNYRANTGNGYFGAYQFSRATWHSLGFKGRPDHAKHATQNRAARDLHARQGWSAWPACSQSEHLAN
jgi:resuscitation-promoting factor RpfA